MAEMLMLQRRFEQRQGTRGARLLEHKRFRAAYDFLLLRASSGEAPQELADWWTEVQRLSPGEQRDSFGPSDERRPRRRRRRRRPRRNAVG
jgi:poly(A) polymerase